MKIHPNNREIFSFEDVLYDVSGLKNEISKHPVYRVNIDEDLWHHVSLYDEYDQERLNSISEQRLNEPDIVVYIENEQM